MMMIEVSNGANDANGAQKISSSDAEVSCIIQLTFIHVQPHLRQFIPDVAGWAMTLFRRNHLGHATR